jgi:hypothetical protein
MGRGGQNNLLYGPADLLRDHISSIPQGSLSDSELNTDYRIEDYKLLNDKKWYYSLKELNQASSWSNHSEMQDAYKFHQNLIYWGRNQNYGLLAGREIDQFFFNKITSKGKGARWWLGTDDWQIRLPETNKKDCANIDIYQSFQKKASSSPRTIGFPAQEKSGSITEQIINYPDFIDQHQLVAVEFNQNSDDLINNDLSIVVRYQSREYQLATVTHPQHIQIIEETVNAPNIAGWHFALGSSKLAYYSKNSKTVYAFAEVQPTLAPY